MKNVSILTKVLWHIWWIIILWLWLFMSGCGGIMFVNIFGWWSYAWLWLIWLPFLIWGVLSVLLVSIFYIRYRKATSVTLRTHLSRRALAYIVRICIVIVVLFGTWGFIASIVDYQPILFDGEFFLLVLPVLCVRYFSSMILQKANPSIEKLRTEQTKNEEKKQSDYSTSTKNKDIA